MDQRAGRTFDKDSNEKTADDCSFFLSPSISFRLAPKRDPVDLYSGGVLYPSIVAGQA